MKAKRILLPFLGAALAGCAATSGDYWRSPSILNTAPPPPVKETKREHQGGFAVLVEAPGQPSVARASADIGAFALRHGFVRQGPDRYISGQIMLDVTFRASDSRVVATLHSFGLSRKFADGFYRDFNREFGGTYGEENPVIETDFYPPNWLS